MKTLFEDLQGNHIPIEFYADKHGHKHPKVEIGPPVEWRLALPQGTEFVPEDQIWEDSPEKAQMREKARDEREKQYK